MTDDLDDRNVEPPLPEDVDEMLAQARDFMNATELVAIWAKDEQLPEAVADLLGAIRQMAGYMRTLAETSRRHPELQKRLPDELDRLVASLEQIAPCRP